MFINDEEKMFDFHRETKENFLATYSYLTEKEYDDTLAVSKVEWTSVIVIECGLVGDVYILSSYEGAERKAIELANKYFKHSQTFSTFCEVDEFQYSFHTDSLEIKIEETVRG